MRTIILLLFLAGSVIAQTNAVPKPTPKPEDEIKRLHEVIDKQRDYIEAQKRVIASLQTTNAALQARVANLEASLNTPQGQSPVKVQIVRPPYVSPNQRTGAF